MRLGILASAEPYRQHVQPIWDALEPQERESFAFDTDDLGAPDVWLTASTRDFGAIRHRHGHKVLMEHGCGLQGYPDYVLQRLNGVTIAAPNDYVAQMYRGHSGRIEIVGTPKMDALVQIPKPEGRTVAISFHWSGITRRRGTTLEEWRTAIEGLAERYDVIGHAHPRVWRLAEAFYREIGVEPVEAFTQVVERADVYAADHSSTLYEWAALERPVILLHREQGRMLVPQATGLRYETYPDIGPTAHTDDLADVVAGVFADDTYGPARAEATAALYPYLGSSTDRVIDLLRDVGGEP